jgi:diamine N-acetyltransferase
MRIVPAQKTDLPEIGRLAEIVWRAHYPGIITVEQIDYMLERMYSLPTMEQELSQGITYLRLLMEEQLAGFASYGPAVENCRCKLHKLYVHPDQQRRGLGALLLGEVEKQARQAGCGALFLTVNKANQQALKAYQKYGFHLREAVVAEIGAGFVMDDFLLEKALEPGRH